MARKGFAREEIVRRKYQSEGWTVLSSGWPDLLCIRGNEIMAVEVKSDTDIIKPNQKIVHIALASHGIEDRTQRVGKIKFGHFLEDLPVMAAYQKHIPVVEKTKEEFEGLGVS